MTAVRRRAAERRVKCHEFSLDSHSKVSSPCPDFVKLGEFQQPVTPGEDYVIEPGNTLVAMASPHGRQELEAALLPS